MKTTRPIVVLFFLLISALLALMGRCFYLQYCRSDFYGLLSVKQRMAHISQQPRRGIILDYRGRVLAASNKAQTVFAEPRLIDDPNKTSEKVALILNTPSQQVLKIITQAKNPGFVTIKKTITTGQNQAFIEAEIRGIGIKSDWQRYYPTGSLTSNVIGFIGTDQTGLAGIELQYDKILLGSQGDNILFVDAARHPIWIKQQKSLGTDGVGLILTLDATIQQFTRDELLKQYQKYEPESAVAIVMEPDTGAVLALVCLPDFDPDNLSAVDPNNLRNRALTDPFEPGSILKPIVAAIAIDDDVVQLNDKIFCEKGRYAGKGFGKIGEYGNHRFGNLTVRDILVLSSNIGMAKIGQKMGKEKLYKGLSLFGFGKKTGIDLTGEAPGLLWPPAKWTGYSVTRIPFGQEISVTAIQIARAFCILANGGRQIRPYMVKAMIDNQGRILKIQRPPNPAGQVIKPEVAEAIVMQALTGVINEGTGKKASLEKWQVFGKTGTANIAKSDAKGYDETAYVASFVGGAPAENPAIVVLVSIRKPNKEIGYTGGTVAAPVVREIIRKTLTYLEQN